MTFGTIIYCFPFLLIGILNYNSEKLRNASAPVAGTYTLGFNNNWTEDIEVHADVEEVCICNLSLN